MKRLVVLALVTGVLTAFPARQGGAPDGGARIWVDSTMAKMSLEQKVGQVIVAVSPTHYTSVRSRRFERIREDIERYHVGGYHAFRGELLSAAMLIRRMQQLARVPLLITADLEGGLGLVFEGGTRFPKAMALGATWDPEKVRRVGQITAREAKLLGININFYPVVDVNNNPENPIINIRSFGEDPDQVGRMAAAYIRGIQEEGLLATAKHFPGHGDTSTDSHLELPVIDVSRRRLEEVELRPFRAAIDAGVAGIMSAHISVPALDSKPGRAATLSHRVLNDLLRGEMGFRGLVITDAMNMGGVNGGGEVEVKAFLAGNDVILFPRSVKTAFQGLLAAVKSGRISEERLDRSVRRILEYKARLGLHQRKSVDLLAIDQDVAVEEHQQAAQEIMDSAVTLVRDERNALPLRPSPDQTVFLLTLLDSHLWRDTRAMELVRELRDRHRDLIDHRAGLDMTRREARLIEALAGQSDFIVVAAYLRVAAFKGELGFSENQLDLLRALSALDKPAAFVVLGSPYLLHEVPELPSCVLTYEDYPGAEAAAVKAILGYIPFRGRLPVSLPDFYPLGHGIQR